MQPSPKGDLDEPMLAPVEIAHMLNMPVKAVRNWLADPDHPLTGTKIGNQWRVQRAHFRQLIKDNKL